MAVPHWTRNYTLEAGTVGTDDENIANILYNINCMETKKNFTSSDLDESNEALGQLYFMVSDAMVHLNRFIEIYNEKIKQETSDDVLIALDDAMQIMDEVEEETDTAKISAVFPAAYKLLLDIVPLVLELDAQAVGRV